MSEMTESNIQPHHLQPRDEHRRTQNASIGPMAQRATSQAVVLPTSQGDQQVQPKVATAQPTVSISRSVSASGTPSIGQQMPSNSQQSLHVEGGEGQRREVGSSSSIDVVVGTSGEVSASSGVATSRREEVVLDNEQEGEDDEDIEDGEVGEYIEEVDQNLEGDDLDEEFASEEDIEQEEDLGIEDPVDVSSEEEGEIGEEQPQAMIPEDNSSEPSSSTGQQGREASGGLAGQAGLAYEQDPGEDSVVPSTPKLPLTRRADGFAEAVSSPQVGDLS